MFVYVYLCDIRNLYTHLDFIVNILSVIITFTWVCHIMTGINFTILCCEKIMMERANILWIIWTVTITHIPCVYVEGGGDRVGESVITTFCHILISKSEISTSIF